MDAHYDVTYVVVVFFFVFVEFSVKWSVPPRVRALVITPLIPVDLQASISRVVCFSKLCVVNCMCRFNGVFRSRV